MSRCRPATTSSLVPPRPSSRRAATPEPARWSACVGVSVSTIRDRMLGASLLPRPRRSRTRWCGSEGGGGVPPVGDTHPATAVTGCIFDLYR